VIRRRHQHVDIATDRFGRGIAEQPFGTAIEGLNRAGRVDDDDAVHRRVNDRVESLRALGRERRFRSARILGSAMLVIDPRDSQSGRHEQAERYDVSRCSNGEAGRWEKEVHRAERCRCCGHHTRPQPAIPSGNQNRGKELEIRNSGAEPVPKRIAEQEGRRNERHGHDVPRDS
jgi:hypothetical protein